jgi:hypothetical protein
MSANTKPVISHRIARVECACAQVFFLGTFATKSCDNATLVNLSVCLEDGWTDFNEIWYWRVFLKFVEAFLFWLRSDKNNVRFTWRPTYVLGAKVDEFPYMELSGNLGWRVYLRIPAWTIPHRESRMGNPQSASQSRGRILRNDVISKLDRRQTPRAYKGNRSQTTRVTGAIHNGQILANWPELLRCAHISYLVCISIVILHSFSHCC